jgi:hypothetical protein
VPIAITPSMALGDRDRSDGTAEAWGNAQLCGFGERHEECTAPNG